MGRLPLVIAWPSWRSGECPSIYLCFDFFYLRYSLKIFVSNFFILIWLNLTAESEMILTSHYRVRNILWTCGHIQKMKLKWHFNKDLLFLCVWMLASTTSECTPHMCRYTLRDQKKGLNPLDLELQMIMGQHVGVLMEPMSSARETSVLDFWDISSVPKMTF